MYLTLGGCTWSGGVHGPGGGGVVYLVPGRCTWPWGGVPGPGEWCTWSRGVYLVLGVYLVPGGCVYLVWGGTWSQGVYLVPGGCTWSGTPPCGQTHACKNITFATPLRTVKMLENSNLNLHFTCGLISFPDWDRSQKIIAFFDYHCKDNV